MKTIVCFGEVLWDVFPTGEKLGGAPFNVCQRLSSLGNKAIMVSAIGRDILGDRITNYFDSKQLDKSFIQLSDEFETGKVMVSLDEHGSPSYEIVQPVAWDYIAFRPEVETLISESDAFVFGSLACRNSVSKDSLLKMIPLSSFTVFDLNLRQPYYTMELISHLLGQVELAKFNDEEVILVAEHFSNDNHSVDSAIEYVLDHFQLSKICVTLGSKGALYIEDGIRYQHPGFPAKVVDTVGAGDSFLAGFVHKLLQGESPEKALEFACAIGSMVASSAGANPDLDAAKLQEMLSKD